MQFKLDVILDLDRIPLCLYPYYLSYELDEKSKTNDAIEYLKTGFRVIFAIFKN